MYVIAEAPKTAGINAEMGDYAGAGQLFVATTRATLEARVMWSEAGLHFKLMVTDPTVEADTMTTQPWRQDSVEIYIDPTGDGGQVMSGADGQVIVTPQGRLSSYSTSIDGKAVKTAAALVQGGYVAELLIPWIEGQDRDRCRLSFVLNDGLESVMLGGATEGFKVPDRWIDAGVDTGVVAPPEEEPSGALPSVASPGSYWVDPIDGSDSVSAAQARSESSEPSTTPWKTLSRALHSRNTADLSPAANGHFDIRVRGGNSYERGLDLKLSRPGTVDAHFRVIGYRDDVKAGTRGGTGKFDGAKGRFCLRGNIEELESAGWERAFGPGRNIYRSVATHKTIGRARGNWLGAATYNLQLWPARTLNDLNTDTITGNGSAVYTGPGVVGSGGRFHVRLDPNAWTDFFGKDTFRVAPTWETDPNREQLAIYDDTVGLLLTGFVRFVDFAFWNIEYWQTPIIGDKAATVRNLDLDYMVLKGSYGTVSMEKCKEFGDSRFTHSDFIVNIPPWGERQWIHGTDVQDQWDALSLNIHSDNTHDFVFEHNRSVRAFDGITMARGGVSARNIVINRNHFLQQRDDTMAFTASVDNLVITNNYLEECFSGIGTYESNVGQTTKGSCWVGFNIFDLRKYSFVYGHRLSLSQAFRRGTSGTAGGLGVGRTDSAHGSGKGFLERKWYNNTVLCAKDRNSNNGATDLITWHSPGVDIACPGEQYNNAFVQIEDASFLGRLKANMLERDFNCSWSEPAGTRFGTTVVKLRPARASGAEVAYTSWEAFKKSGAHYEETKHARGQGPGSPAGWDANGKYENPDFVNGKFGTVVPGDLATYFPKEGGNLRGAADLTRTKWPGCDKPAAYCGAYQSGDPINAVGPEQGIWVD